MYKKVYFYVISSPDKGDKGHSCRSIQITLFPQNVNTLVRHKFHHQQDYSRAVYNELPCTAKLAEPALFLKLGPFSIHFIVERRMTDQKVKSSTC